MGGAPWSKTFDTGSLKGSRRTEELHHLFWSKMKGSAHLTWCGAKTSSPEGHVRKTIVRRIPRPKLRGRRRREKREVGEREREFFFCFARRWRTCGAEEGGWSLEEGGEDAAVVVVGRVWKCWTCLVVVSWE